jgi:hypothetical protein
MQSSSQSSGSPKRAESAEQGTLAYFLEKAKKIGTIRVGTVEQNFFRITYEDPAVTNPMLKRLNIVLASGEFQTFCEKQCPTQGPGCRDYCPFHMFKIKLGDSTIQ